jgi:23S rRNA pseudouridine1911/1915/1917 synthase
MYLAVLDGVPAERRGVIDAPIALEREGAPRRVVREDGAPSRSFYRVIETYAYGAGCAGAGVYGIYNEGNVAGVARGGEESGDLGAGDGVPSGEVRRVALALISITTGRTHQIRVHMAHIGCPVMGDALYGGRSPGVFGDGRLAAPADDVCGGCGDGSPLIGRQALHAAVLRFAHPRTREEITAVAPLPSDMAACLRSLRRGAAEQ